VAKQEDAMTKPKTKRQGKPARKTKLKPQRRLTNAVAPNPDRPHRVGTLYASLFTEGNRDYVSKDELIRKVAELTGKSEKVVNFAFQVLKSPKPRSNKNRSTMLTEGDKVKLIAIRK
jgi:hypothetical protein